MPALSAPRSAPEKGLPSRGRFSRRKRDSDHRALQIAAPFQSEADEITQLREPPAARLILHAIIGLIVVALLLASVLRLDRVVTTVGGEITSVEPNIVMQALEDSIIRSLNVKEGDTVRAGQLLARLDPTFTTADVNQLELQIKAANAQIARLEAERDGKNFLDHPLAQAKAGDAVDYAALQRNLFTQRQAQFNAQRQSFSEKIAQTNATIEKLHTEEKQLLERLTIFKEIESMRATLEASKVGSRLQLLQSIDQRIEIGRNLESARNSLKESTHELASLIADREAFVQQWFGQINQDLVTTSQTRDTAVEQLSKARKRLDLVSMSAPENGVVLRVAKLSVGSVLKGGEQLFQIVPMRSPLEAEVQVAARDIGFIRPGDPCTIKLDPFNFVEHGWIDGHLRWVSEGVFTTNDDGSPAAAYYKARVTLDEIRLRNVPETARLVPGMQLTGDIHVGSRTVLAYFFHGLIRNISEAMRER